MPGKNSRQSSYRVEWAPPALQAYRDTLRHIAEQDAETLAQFEQRVMRAVSLLAEQPGIGTLRTLRGKRAFAVPNTGHTVEYQAREGILRILRWYRQRRKRT